MPNRMDRRGFLAGAASLALGAGAAKRAFAGETAADAADGGGGRILFGSCVKKPDDVKELQKSGGDFWEWSVAEAFNPDKDGEWWKRQRDMIASQPLPLRSCTGFIPGRFRLTGPAADHAPALVWAETALRRADEAGVPVVVFGSGGARNVPGDFTAAKRKDWPDIQKGERQFVEFLAELTRRVADLRRVKIAIEPLRPNESNIVNFVWQAALIAEEAGSPLLGITADMFHMMMGREGPESITRHVKMIRHCHIATRGSRRYPGENEGETSPLVPYMQALKAAGYSGGVSCECGWPGKKRPFGGKFAKALSTMKGMIR